MDKDKLLEDALTALQIAKATIQEQDAQIKRLELALALKTHKAPVGRPRKPKSLIPEKPGSKRPGPKPEISDESLMLINLAWPKIKNLPEYERWRIQGGHRISRRSAVLWFLELCYSSRGEGKYKVNRILNTISNRLSKLEKSNTK